MGEEEILAIRDFGVFGSFQERRGEREESNGLTELKLLEYPFCSGGLQSVINLVERKKRMRWEKEGQRVGLEFMQRGNSLSGELWPRGRKRESEKSIWTTRAGREREGKRTIGRIKKFVSARERFEFKYNVKVAPKHKNTEVPQVRTDSERGSVGLRTDFPTH